MYPKNGGVRLVLFSLTVLIGMLFITCGIYSVVAYDDSLEGRYPISNCTLISEQETQQDCNTRGCYYYRKIIADTRTKASVDGILFITNASYQCGPGIFCYWTESNRVGAACSYNDARKWILFFNSESSFVMALIIVMIAILGILITAYGSINLKRECDRVGYAELGT